MRCRILVENIAPTVLLGDVKRLVEMTHRDARKDDVLLYQLTVKRVTMQHHFHLRTVLEHGAGGDGQGTEGCAKIPVGSHVDGDNRKVCWRQNGREHSREATSNIEGLIVEQSGMMSECPIATDAEKEAAVTALREKRKSPAERAKHVGEGTDKKVVLVNGILEIPLCSDTGSDRNIISRDYLKELKEQGAKMVTTPLVQTITAKATGRAEEGATLGLILTTAAGPLHLSLVPVVVLEGLENKFVFGRITLKQLGIDIDHSLEQLASGGTDGGVGAGKDDDLPPDEELGFEAEDDDVATAVETLVDNAVQNGFSIEHVEELRDSVLKFPDVFRLHIGNDPAADVELLEVQVVPGVQPFRCKLRKYPERQRAFLREYVQQLVDARLVKGNNESRWLVPRCP
ncbi:hypothetical protein PHMEG_00032354 [Phytophthora megakarya]|uniref:Uncharacterized protein n=1 Tax=Phytophthora megakarya TaxID=4795 RepID=A0A225UYC6_9STRA|nr:hypothetical protein PHMEG_00032354 [Phytophthora megakarya]